MLIKNKARQNSIRGHYYFETIMKRKFTFTIIIFLSLINSVDLTATETQLNCDDGEGIVEAQTGLFVRPSNNGIIFKDENIANIGFIIGDKAVAVIDTGGSIKEGQNLICQIKKVTKLPIRYVINTHVHPDHTMGNGAFNDPDITFIGHKNLAHAMGVLSKTYLRRYNEETGSKISDKTIILPKTQVEDELEIDLGNRPITIIATQKAHTNNDIMVHDEKTDTLWLSDLLFHKHIPVMGKSGSVGGWLDVIKKIKNKKVKNIIPGHGPLKMDNDDATDSQTRYLTLLRDEIRKNISTDSDLTSAMERIGLEESSKWQMFDNFHKRNISYIFSELEWE